MDLLGCHIELLTQLLDLLARDHVETYMYSSSKPYGHIKKQVDLLIYFLGLFAN
jgi:hypothetical protein